MDIMTVFFKTIPQLVCLYNNKTFDCGMSLAKYTKCKKTTECSFAKGLRWLKRASVGGS